MRIHLVALTVPLAAIVAVLLIVWVWSLEATPVVIVREPTQTPWIVVVTATPRAVEAGPPTTWLPTATMTPLPDRLPFGTPLPSPTARPAPPTPDWLPTPRPTPNRPVEQKG